MRNPLPILPLTLAIAAALAAAGCGQSSTAPEPASTAPAAEAPVAEAPAEIAAEEAAAELAAREQELAAQSEELARREAELAEREAAAAQAAAARLASAPAAKPTPTAKPPAAAKPTPAPAPAPAAPPPPVTVAAGTQLAVNLEDAYSTKTNTVGQPVSARLASDLLAGGRVIARAGAPIRGSITEVTSGSSKIGAVPALKIDFTELVMADGSTMTINARINQKGQSEKGRDTAKIAGGTAAGAIIGHQIDDDKGKVIGGIIGGAAGAIGAKKTGTEVEIPAGTVLQANLRSEFVYSGS
jgi:type IV secretory pathway VirB10-like protein